ncbi:MAG: DNA polymerase IV [Acidimicrobiia bacterium]|nr:DNA polymerase IV [Acidimicrobiia bacterium]
MAGAASILHIDLDAFYASAEVLRNPSLEGRPVAVGGGVVLSATYEARRFGVRSGMSIRDAKSRCPGLIVVSGEFADYAAYSQQVMEIFRRFTPLVEPISIDEAFLDVGGSAHLFGPPVTIGQTIRRTIRSETGLPASVGIATTKFLAKVASRVAKPDGLVAVAPGTEIQFLHPLDVDAIWGVGPVTRERLAGYGIRSVGDLAAVPVDALAAWLGIGAGRHLHALAWNQDPRPVTRGRRAGSVGAQSTFGRDVTDPAEHRRILLRLAERVGSRLRTKGRAGRTVTAYIRFADFETVTRQMRLPGPTAATSALFRAGCRLTDQARREVGSARGLRLLGISVSHLERLPSLQMELPLEGDDLDDPILRPGSHLGSAHRSLDAAVERARSAFGRESVGRAALLGLRRQYGPTRDRLPGPEDL